LSPTRPARTSLRFRLGAALVLLGIAVLALQALVVARFVEQQEEEFINEILGAEMERFVTRARGDAPADGPAGRITRYVARDAAERERLPAYLRELPAGLHEVLVGGAELHVAVRREGATDYYLSYDVARHEERIHEVQHALLVVLGAAFVALVALAFWLSGVLSRQVSDLARRVARLEPDAAHASLAVQYRDREVLTLASALDDYARRVSSLIAREKEFTANVSHELRTPLTTIKTSCELLAEDPALSERSRNRTRAIGASASHIAELIDALLLLGRETPVGAEDDVDLAELIGEAAVPLRGALEAKGLRLAIEVPRGAGVRANRTALQLTLTNLLKNAIAYTDRGEIRVRYADGELAVSDTGVGIAPGELPRVFERAFRGANARAGGTGLGLAIVKRIAERFGWRIDAESAPGSGTTFRIRLRGV
jgi:signal transduction histidine kinase